MVDTQTILQFIPAVSLSIAAIYYMLILRNQNRTRQAQLFMQLFQHNMTKEWMKDWWELMQMQWDDIEDFYEKYDSSVNIDNFAKRFRAWFFLDGVGLLMKKGLIDREMVYYLMGGYLGNWLWEKFGDVIKYQRELNNIPELCVWFEYLAVELMKMKKQQGMSLKIPENWGAIKPKG
jgi:hypothetical protein